MREIGELVADILKEAGMEAAEELTAIKKAWRASPICPAYADPYRLEGGKLFVRVGSHAWAQEIRFAADAIRDEIRGKTGVEIGEIRIKVNVR